MFPGSGDGPTVARAASSRRVFEGPVAPVARQGLPLLALRVIGLNWFS